LNDVGEAYFIEPFGEAQAAYFGGHDGPSVPMKDK
jgi:hypothetical protein